MKQHKVNGKKKPKNNPQPGSNATGKRKGSHGIKLSEMSTVPQSLTNLGG